MWKIVVGFIVFALLALFLLNKGGDIDISGEKHGAAPALAPVVMLADEVGRSVA
jgi:hypothetical protein